MRQFRETGVVADGGEGGVDARPRGEDLCLEGEGRSRVVTGQVGGEEGAPCAHKAPTSSPGPIKCGVMMRRGGGQGVGGATRGVKPVG